MVRHGGKHAGMDQSMLLAMALRWNQNGLAHPIVNLHQFNAEIANEADVHAVKVLDEPIVIEGERAGHIGDA